MSNRRFEMYQYRQIVMQMRLGESNRAIARLGLAGRRKLCHIREVARLKGWLKGNAGLPGDGELSQAFESVKQAQAMISLSASYEAEIKGWVGQGISAIVIYQTLLRKHGFLGSYDSVQRFVQKLKAQDAGKGASCVLEFNPAQAAQVDFGKGVDLLDELTGQIIPTWIFVMTLCFSRHQYAEIVRHQDVETWLGCHKRAFEFFAGVPHKVIIDNAKCAITRACYYDPQVQRAYAECAEGYGFIISPCPPREPKKKGRVEAGVKYIKNNFMPLRQMRSLTDGNQQLKAWVLEEAGNRVHGSTHLRPLSVFMELERHVLKPLPANPPELCTWIKVKVHGDCHVQYLKNRYSVPYQQVHQLLWLRVSETTVRAYRDHEQVAIHPRLKGQGQRSSQSAHFPPDARAYLMRDPAWCREQAGAIGEHCKNLVETLFADKVLDQLRAVQGIIGLVRSYGKNRVNAACCRALRFESLKYRTVKQILQQGLDYEPLAEEDAFDLLGASYKQGKYCRRINSIH